MASTPVFVAPARPHAIVTQRVSASPVILGAAAITVALLLVSRLHYVPMWDGLEYASAIGRAAETRGPGWLRLAGHASHAYALLVVGAQMIAPGQYWPILATNALLLVVAGLGFFRLCSIVFPGRDHDVERALLTAAFVLQPALLAAVVQPGLDFPVVPAFLWTTVFALEKRWLAMAATGIALAFTKETGVLLYAGLLASLVVWDPRIALGRPGRRALALARVVVIGAPGIVFALYLLYRAHSVPAGEPVVWNAGTQMIGQSLLRQLIVPRIDRYLASYLAIALVLNFAWIVTLVAVGGGVVTARRALRHERPLEALRASMTSTTGFLVVLSAISGYLLTRFASYANARYLLVVMALLLPLCYAALVTMRTTIPVRRLILGTLVVLLGVATVRTVDPVSRRLFGTFPFGEHSMLRMTSVSHECCASGRDQLVYSLEFTTLAALTDDALGWVQAGDSVLVVLPDSTNWHAIRLLDRVTGRRTLDRFTGIAPKVTESDSAGLLANDGSRAAYIALPNGDRARGLDQLSNTFVIGRERRVSRGGYWLSVYGLTRRPRGG